MKNPIFTIKFPLRYLVAIDPDTNEVVERYESINAAVRYNPTYKYFCLSNAIYQPITYKGYKWKWVNVDKANETDLDTEFKNEMNSIIEATKLVMRKLK